MEAPRERPIDAPPQPESLADVDRAIDDDIRALRLSQLRQSVSELQEIRQTAADDGARDTVRGRLGLPSRRDFLTRAAATAVVMKTGLGEKQAAAAESSPIQRTPEQVRAYQEGLARMRASAVNGEEEIARYFITRTDGTSEWVDIKTETFVNQRSTAASAQVVFPDSESRDRVQEALAAGASAEDLHTHPTSAFPGSADGKRVPPSPFDILHAIKAYGQASPEAVERMKFSVVTEDGVWNYTPASREAAQKLDTAFRAGTPTLELLKNKYPEHGRELAAYLKKELPRIFPGEQNGTRDLFEQAVPLIESGEIIDGLESSTTGLERLGDFGVLLMVRDPAMPPGPRLYLRALARAGEEVKEAVKKIAPGTDGLTGDVPVFGHYQEYTTRWKALGINMDFTPF